MKNNRFLNGLMTGSLLLACSCTNIFTSFANTQSDEAMFEQLQSDVNAKDWNSAIALIPNFSTTYQERADVKSWEASAYLGRAGLDYLTFVQNLANLNLTNTDLFLFFMKQFDHGTAASEADAITAEQLLLSISTSPPGYTPDQLMELVLAGMVKMGSIISRYGDTNSDGSIDGGFDSCAGIPAADAAQFGVSFNVVLMALTQLAVDGVNLGPAGVSGVCDPTTGLPHAWTLGGLPLYDFCGNISPSTYTPTQVKGVLSVIREKALKIGIGTCVSAPFDAVTCHC